jgi:acyl-CoA thioester hydrolase
MSAPGRHRLDIQVRFADSDAIGHVNNACFATYTELARLNFLREIGHRPDSLILAHLSIDFRRQVQLKDRVHVESWVDSIGTSSFSLRQDVHANDGVAAEVRAVMVGFDYQAQRSEPLPADVREWLERHRG